MLTLPTLRRRTLLSLLGASLLAACASPPPANQLPPIVFVTLDPDDATPEPEVRS